MLPIGRSSGSTPKLTRTCLAVRPMYTIRRSRSSKFLEEWGPLVMEVAVRLRIDLREHDLQLLRPGYVLNYTGSVGDTELAEQIGAVAPVVQDKATLCLNG